MTKKYMHVTVTIEVAIAYDDELEPLSVEEYPDEFQLHKALVANYKVLSKHVQWLALAQVAWVGDDLWRDYPQYDGESKGIAEIVPMLYDDLPDDQSTGWKKLIEDEFIWDTTDRVQHAFDCLVTSVRTKIK